MLSKTSGAITAILLLLTTLGTAAAEDWPKYHHDIRNTGYTDSPAPGFPNLLWSKLWRFSSSVSVADGRVYVAGLENNDTEQGYFKHNFNMFAFNAENGQEIWRFEIDNLLIAFSTPAFYKGKVYFGTIAGYVYALDAESGA